MRRSSLFLLIISCLFSQADINFSLETKYGDGSQITSLGSATPDTSDYRYFENVLDINSSYRDNLYIFLQLEYSDPPIFGFNVDGVNAMYLEYNQDKLNVRAGNLYTMYGRGMSFRTFQDQNIDFENSLKGVELNYDIHEQVRLFALMGQGTYYYRGNPAVIVPDRHLNNKAILFGTDLYTDKFGDFTFLYFENDQELPEEVILSYEAEISDNRLSRDLFSRISFQDVRDDTVHYFNRTLAWNKSIGVVDIYIEKAWNNYTKILGDRVTGSMFYSALSADIFNTGISWEFKDYNMPFFIQSLSNPPTLDREASSVLVSRNAHTVIFGDEKGHQIEINREFLFGSHLLANLSLSNRQKGFGTNEYQSFNLEESEGVFNGYWQTDSSVVISTKKPSFGDMLTFAENENVRSHFPYRQLYAEISGWGVGDALYYKAGLDQYDEIIKYHDQINYISNSTMTNADLQNYLQNYYYDYYWEIWNQNYFPEYGLDSTYADGVFESLYGAPVDSVIVDYVEASFLNVSPQLADIPLSESDYEKVSAFTIPLQFAFDVKNIGAFTVYIENQRKTVTTNKDRIYPDGHVENDLSQKESYDLNYFSVSYRHPLDFSITLFYESEGYEKKLGDTIWSSGTNHWTGFDFTCDLNDNSQLSIFLGSQKGGRVCANGICADQPGFENGIKITFRSIF